MPPSQVCQAHPPKVRCHSPPVRGSDPGAAERGTPHSTPANAHPGRRTRSGGEYSPFLADAVAVPIRCSVRLSQLLARREEGPDSDDESIAGDEPPDEADNAPRPPTPPPATPSKWIPGPWYQHAPPGHPPGARLPNGSLPGPAIRCARPPPPARKATPAEVKARRLAKKHLKDRPARCLDREQRRVIVGSRLKGVARLRVRRAVPIQVTLSLEEFTAPVASSGWQAIRRPEPNACAYGLDEALEVDPEMWVYDWQGVPTPIVDADGRVLLVLGGFPPDEGWAADVADIAAAQMQAAALEIYSEPRWRRKAGLTTPSGRRGPHKSKHVGPAMGGGQEYPQNLAHSVRNLAIFAGLLGQKTFERIAGWTNMLFMAFAPDLHEFYRQNLADLCEWDRKQKRAKHILRNFGEAFSVFATATFNFGPATVTFPHLDFGNLAWGWCAITALGSFDPDCGGHLILWDLKMIIRFPPGSTILLPSAILRHSNVKIGPNETRFSFTQFTPAGLFRWVYNSFQTDKDINSSSRTTDELREQRARDRAERWREGVGMYRTWDGPVAQTPPH